jgi:predicted transcriptional regulator
MKVMKIVWKLRRAAARDVIAAAGRPRLAAEHR